MASSMKTTYDNLASKLLASGYFDAVNKVEPKAAPGNGFEASVFWRRAAPFAGGSGLAVTAMVYVMQIRIYRNMLSEPPGDIDSDLLAIADDVLDDLQGDFDLGATVRNVDVFGQAGEGLRVEAGYVDVSGTMYRVIDISVPVIVNDVSTQTA